MKIFITTSLLFIIQFFSAQDENSFYGNGVFNYEENKIQKIFVDQTRIRESPNINAKILDSLSSNHQVLILKKENAFLKLGERYANWYKISYQKNEVTNEGYVWGGNLCVGFRHKNGLDFLFGIPKTVNKKDKNISEETFSQNMASIKALEGNHLLDEVSFNTGTGESLSYATFSVESNHKLNDVELTLNAHVSGEACGVASYTQYVLFSDKKLIALPQLMNVGDADVFYHSEEFVFPNDKGGIPNAFIFKMEEMEKDEKEREKKKRASKTYLWNGNSYKLK